MWSWIKRKLGIGSKPVVVEKPKPVEPPPTAGIIIPAPPEQPEPIEKPANDDQITRWTKAALEISQSFEGETRWANITGNFDDMGLTCGALGWTWHYGDQQRLVKEFVKKHGAPLLYKYMPVVGRRYLALCEMGRDQSMGEVSSWSNGRSRVQEPHNKELHTFWASPEMRDIQLEEVKRSMTKFAMDNIKKFKKPPTFKHFAWLFDTRVLNGSLKGVDISATASESSMDQILDAIEGREGYNEVDADKNAKLWQNRRLFEPDEYDLFALAWRRSVLCRRSFVLTTMNRRGTLSVGCGWVNGKLRYPYDEAGINPHEPLEKSFLGLKIF
jgi:hypothetical protein